MLRTGVRVSSKAIAFGKGKYVHGRQPGAPEPPGQRVIRHASVEKEPGQESGGSDEWQHGPSEANPPEDRAYGGPSNHGDSNAPTCGPITVDQGYRQPPALCVPMDVRHILHLQSCEDDAPDHCQPPGRSLIEVMLAIARGNLHRAGTVTDVAESVEKVANERAVVCSAKIIVHPRSEHQGDCLPGAAQAQGRQVDGWDDEQEEGSRLFGGDTLRGYGPPWFVKRILKDRLGLGLVAEVEEEQTQPVPSDGAWDPAEDLPWVWAVIVGEQTTGKSSGDSEDCFRHDDTLDIADGEEPDGVRVVEKLGELARLVSGGRRSGVGARVFGEGGLAILVDCRNEYAGSVAQHVG